MRARLLADADLDHRIAIGLKRIEPEIDFRTANEAVLEGVPDFEVLQLAANEDRVLVSHDRRTMPAAFYAFIRERTSPGLILLKQGCAIARAIEELRICYRALDAEEFANRIRYLPL